MQLSTVVETAAIAAVVVALQIGTLVQGVAKPVAMAVHSAETSQRRAAPHRPQFHEVIEVRGSRIFRGI